MAKTPEKIVGYDNYISNGNFDFWQRGTGTTISNTTAYLADRWYGHAIGAGTLNFSQSSAVPNSKSRYSAILLPNVADTSMDATDIYMLRQSIEGQYFRPLHGKAMTLSFWVRSNVTGLYSVCLNNGSDKRYVATYTINSGSTWEYKTISLTHNSSGTWAVDNSLGFNIQFILAAGSNFHTATLNQWQTSSTALASAAQVNLMSSTSNDFRISQVMLNEGLAPAPFKLLGESIDGELAHCQRYYFKTFPQATAPAQNAGTTGVLEYRAPNNTYTNGGAGMTFPVSMRTSTPGIVTYNPSAANGNWRNMSATADSGSAPTGSLSESYIFITDAGITATAGQVIGIHFTADAEL